MALVWDDITGAYVDDGTGTTPTTGDTTPHPVNPDTLTGNTSQYPSVSGYVDTSGNWDWTKILAGGATALSAVLAYQAAANSNHPVGYQGGIPTDTALRAATTLNTTRRPGAGGQRYFTDTQYANAAADQTGPQGLAALQASVAAQKTALNAANASLQATPVYQNTSDPNSNNFYGRTTAGAAANTGIASAANPKTPYVAGNAPPGTVATQTPVVAQQPPSSVTPPGSNVVIPAINVTPPTATTTPTEAQVRAAFAAIGRTNIAPAGLAYWMDPAHGFNTPGVFAASANNPGAQATAAAIDPGYATAHPSVTPATQGIAALHTAQAPTSVADMYQQVLGRAPQQTGLDYWTQQFGTGAPTAAQVAQFTATAQNAINADPSSAATLAPKLTVQHAKGGLVALAGGGIVAFDGGGMTPEQNTSILSFWNANKNDPKAVMSAMQQYGVSAADLAAATGQSLPTLLSYLQSGGSANGFGAQSGYGAAPTVSAGPAVSSPALPGASSSGSFMPDLKQVWDPSMGASGGWDMAASKATNQADYNAERQARAAYGISQQAINDRNAQVDATGLGTKNYGQTYINAGADQEAQRMAVAKGVEALRPAGAGPNWSPTPDQVNALAAQFGNITVQHSNPTAQDAPQHAKGGLMGLAKGRYLQGPTDGMADKIPARIDGNQEAALAHGEFVVPADVVSHLGNGNSDAGAQKLYEMMNKVRFARTGRKSQGKEINPNSFMPVKMAGGGAVQHYDGTTGTQLVPSGPGVIGTESNLSNWVGPYVTDMLGKAQAQANTPYQAFPGALTAGPSDLQNQGFSNAANLQTPSSINYAANTAGNVAQAAGTMDYTGTNFGNQYNSPSNLGYTAQQATAATGSYNPNSLNNYQMGPAQGVGSTDFTQPGVAGSYMNPYMQNVVDVQQKEAQRQADIATTGRHTDQVQQGAYGGSRGAIMDAEAARNLATQQGTIQATGLQNSYQQAQTQFNADQARNLTAQQANQGAGVQVGTSNLGAALQTQALGTNTGTQYGLASLGNTQAANMANAGASNTASQFGAGQALQSAGLNAQYGLSGQQATEASNQFGANYGLQGLQTQLSAAGVQGNLGATQNQAGLNNLNAQLTAGGTQQGITQAGLTADQAAFNQENNYGKNQLLFQQSMLQGLPLSAQAYNTYTNPYSAASNATLPGATGLPSLINTAVNTATGK